MSSPLDTLKYDLNEATGQKLDIVLNPDHESHGETLAELCLTSKKVIWKDRGYMVLKYVKDKLTPDTVETSGLFRSVIVSLSNNKIVGFAPPKSVPYQRYKLAAAQPWWSDVLLQEFVEGTMVNMFCVDGEWELATRSLVGANGRFFNEGGKTTFRSMFHDAVRAAGPPNKDLDSFYAKLDPELCYSFIFHHPDNQIVTAVEAPKLYLIRAYRIVDGVVTEYLSRAPEIRDITQPGDVAMTVEQPWDLPKDESEHWHDFESLEKYWSSLNRPHTEMGVVVVDPVRNVRTKLRNPSFEMVRHLRGNQPKLQFQYLALRKDGKVGQYLRFYKQASETFSKYREQLHNFTRTLHDNYVQCFVKKTQPLKEFSGQFKPHMYALHGQYLSSLREKGECVNMQVVIKYVNDLPTPRLMFSLNWHPRQNAAEERRLDQASATIAA